MSKKLDEFGLIESYFAPLSAKGAFNLKDDAALIATNPDEELVITQDAVAEGIHFFADDPADVIAQKALRVNLSIWFASLLADHRHLLTLRLVLLSVTIFSVKTSLSRLHRSQVTISVWLPVL